jgi:lycopene cyclase domain-containing protein
MSTYLTINIIIIAFPLFFSFLPFLGLIKNLKALAVSIISVGLLFFIWDSFVTFRGDWMFNPAHITGLKLLNLPIEEALFFITVPFSCIFLYEGLARYFKESTVLYSRKLYIFLGYISFMAALIFYYRGYTCIVLAVLGITMFLAAYILKDVFSSRIYWLWMLCGMTLFFVFNYFLTSIPVVLYNPYAITNIRILTIPIEDFLYNFSMLTLYLAVYLNVKKKVCRDSGRF